MEIIWVPTSAGLLFRIYSRKVLKLLGTQHHVSASTIKSAVRSWVGPSVGASVVLDSIFPQSKYCSSDYLVSIDLTSIRFKGKL